ncbi:hypothetical protein LIER_36623 [Lithospermum erythrorhizon]|uniref:Pentatricopeptide repeat-containing protein n=1 Tax=Lithospermum erythrorhizon TaxID=34254 RepID=A0AAV3PBC4_LITER
MQAINSTLTILIKSCIESKSLKAGKIIHARIYRLGLNWDIFLFNRIIELYKKCGKITHASHVFDTMSERNIYSWTTMLSVYCEDGHLDKAYQVFLSMPERMPMSWNMMISALSRNGHERKALEVYKDMVFEGFGPTRYTLCSVVNACGGLGNLGCGVGCRGVALKLGLDKNVYVANSLLRMYAKCGRIEDACRVFFELEDVNEVSFTAMMGVLAENDRVEEAFKLFKLLHTGRNNVDSVLLSTVLTLCARETDEVSCNVLGKQSHGLVIKLGVARDQHLSNTLINFYTKSGDMESAERLFSNLSEVNIVSWNVMIGGFGQINEKEKAIEYIEMMQNAGFEPNDVTYTSMLSAYFRCGDVESCRRLFDRIPSPVLTSFNAMISGYLQNGYFTNAIALFREMQFQNVKYDHTTLAVILTLCAELTPLEAGRQIHAAIVKSIYHSDMYVSSGLIGMYLNCSKVKEANNVFEGMIQIDVVCWNSMIAGLSLNSLDSEAFAFFRRMLENGVTPTEVSHATVFSCCAKLSSLSQGRQVHCLIVKDGYAHEVFVGSALIDMYCKCGDVYSARKFFDTMKFKSTITWNSMIHGYAQNHIGDEAVSLYNQMLSSGAKPDAVTFIAVLTACNHSRLIDKANEIFDSMQQEHGVVPLVDHYACIIDSLGSAGRFTDVEGIIDTLPCKDNQIIWEVVLSSCTNHGHVYLARRAANELFRLDPKSSTPYVLLANMYSSLGRWDDVRTVREEMTGRQISKCPGYTRLDHIEE